MLIICCIILEWVIRDHWINYFLKEIIWFWAIWVNQRGLTVTNGQACSEMDGQIDILYSDLEKTFVKNDKVPCKRLLDKMYLFDVYEKILKWAELFLQKTQELSLIDFIQFGVMFYGGNWLASSLGPILCMIPINGLSLFIIESCIEVQSMCNRQENEY